MYKPHEFAKLIGVSVKTLQRWDNEGVLIASRNPKNRRYYTEEQLDMYLNKSPVKSNRKIVMYTRVSNRNQTDDLKNQQNFIREHINAKGLILNDDYSDIASGLNYKRPSWNKLIHDVMDNQIDKIFITYKDRFVRFGYEWFEDLCKKFNTEIIVLNNKELSPAEEMTEDLISIIHVFSCRIYGLRKYKKAIADDKNLQD